jgi:RNA polymerase sigma factor (sigma-70 family)
VIPLAAVPEIGRATGVERHSSIAEATAVERLYERHSRRIFSFCLYHLRKRDAAEDAVQTTFMYALGALRRGVTPEAEAAWLLKIAHNVCLTRFDADRRRGKIEVARDPQVLAELAPARAPEDGELLRVGEALARLPERQRRAILLREWQGLSYAEIAVELSLSEAAVETLLFRARRALARELLGADKTRRHGFDLAGLLGWAKSLVGGGAVKLAVGAAAVATLGAAASVPLAHRSHAEPVSVVPQRDVSVHRSSAPGFVAKPARGASKATNRSSHAPAKKAAHTARTAPSVGSSATTSASTGSVAESAAPARADQTGGAADSAAAPIADATAWAPSSPRPSAPAATTSPPAAAPSTLTESISLPSLPPVSTPTVSVEAPPLPPVPTVSIPSVPVEAPPLPSPPPVSTPSLPGTPSVPDATSAPALPLDTPKTILP